MEANEEDHSILHDLGQEITGIATPVSVCMIITIFLVRLLHDGTNVDSSSVAIATAGYHESAGDTRAQKLGGSLLNALIFITIVVVMTFVIVLLFKYGCVKIILYYMGVATFVIFFFMTGFIVVDFVKKIDVHLDAISLFFLLYNFAAVGSVCIFFMPAPLALKQGYLVWTGVVVAYIFTFIPEWTTWILLVAMSLYDLCAVLTPHGPLQMLVNMAIERQEDIPALVYEARAPPPRPRRPAQGEGEGAAAPVAEGHEGAVLHDSFVEVELIGKPGLQALQAPQFVAPFPARAPTPPRPPTLTPTATWGQGRDLSTQAASRRESDALDDDRDDATGTPLLGNPPFRDERSQTGREHALSLTAPVVSGAESRSPAAPAEGLLGEEQPRRLPRRPREGDDDEEEDRYGLGMPASVRLGLGDFIFYSVLVGRASLYDFMTVYASFIGVIAGLGITLLLLAMMRKALPALPVSIALGIIFYFLTRLVLEPFVVPNFVNLINW